MYFLFLKIFSESSSTFTISENPNRSPTGFEATYRRRRDTVIRVPRRSAHHYQHHQQCDKHQRLSLRSHKPSCRYFGVRHNSQPKGRKSNKVKRRPCYTSPNKESDDTGADLSLPSDFLDSNASDIARESHPKPINRDNRKLSRFCVVSSFCSSYYF